MISDERLKLFAEWEPVNNDHEQKEIADMATELLARREADNLIVSGSTWIDDGYVCRFTRSKPLPEPPEVQP